MRTVRLSSRVQGAEDTLRRWISGAAASVFAHDDVIAQMGLLRDQLLSGRPDWSPGVLSVTGTSTTTIPLVGWTWGKTPPADAANGRLSSERSSAADALGYAIRTVRSSRRLVPSSSVGSVSDFPLEAAVVGEPQQALLMPSGAADRAMVDLHPGVARSSLEAFTYARRVLDGLRRGESSVSVPPGSVSWMAREYQTSSWYTEIAVYAAIAAGTTAGLYALGAFRSKKEAAPSEDEFDDESSQDRRPPSKPAAKKSRLPLPENPYGDPRSRLSLDPFS